MIEYDTSVFKGQGYEVRIHKPRLTANEKYKREEELKKALCQFERERRKSK